MDLQKLSEDYLAVKAQIEALEEQLADIKEQIDTDVNVKLASNDNTKKWSFPSSEVLYVDPTVRPTLEKALLVQNGVTADIIRKCTVDKPVKGYAKVLRRKGE